MLDHLGVNVPDLVAARQYYDVVMPLLGFEPFFWTDKEFSYQRVDGMALHDVARRVRSGAEHAMDWMTGISFRAGLVEEHVECLRRSDVPCPPSLLSLDLPHPRAHYLLDEATRDRSVRREL